MNRSPRLPVLFGALVCLFAPVSWGASRASSPGALPPERLRVSEGFENPIGFYDANPTFSWTLPQDGSVEKQTAYRIVAGSEAFELPEEADLWDTGEVRSAQTTWVPWGGLPLASRQRVFWRVQFWDQRGNPSPWSEPAFFELGLLNNQDWEAQWIRLASEKLAPAPAEWFHKLGGVRVPPGPRPPVVEIKSATWGVPGKPHLQVDATEVLKARVSEGTLGLKPDNRWLGSDPAPGRKKTLALELVHNGHAHAFAVPEGQAFDLALLRIGSPTDQVLTPERLRREFSLPDDVVRARLHVSARGMASFFLNGERVSEDRLLPGWVPDRARHESLSYDVTERLSRGDNALGVELSQGWYAGRVRHWHGTYGKVRPDAIARLEVELANGDTFVLVSDHTWQATDDGPLRFAGVWDGVVHDARREMPGWSQPGFDASAWGPVKTTPLDPHVALAPKRHPGVRVAKELPAQSVREVAPGTWVLDLGQNMVGVPQLRVPVQAGRLVTVRVAEMLQPDQTLYTENYRSARSACYWTPAETATLSWEPRHSFFGFRYVELSGLADGCEPSTDWVVGRVLHSVMPDRGSFTSSDPTLNQLHHNIRWGQRGNFVDLPTDCPQRDERLGWTGDAQVFCATSMFGFDVHAFWASWLQSVREDQGANGHIPNFVPTVREEPFAASSGWGDVIVVAPWEIYVRTADRRILAENLPAMRAWVQAYRDQMVDFRMDRHTFGDWLAPPLADGTDRPPTDPQLINLAYFGRSLGLLERVEAVLGHRAEAEARARELEEIRGVFSDRYFDETGRVVGVNDTQTTYLMALGFDLLRPQLRPGAVEHLVAKLEASGGNLGTGFLGTPLLAPVLDRFGHADVAYEALFKRSYPSWFFSIDQGATTMWERWNGFSGEHGFATAKMNSFNHYAYGAIGEWMYEGMAGLAPDPERPGYEHFFVRPTPDSRLGSARAELETPHGTAASGWELRDGVLHLEARVPPNTTATLVLPRSAAEPQLGRAGGDALRPVFEEGRWRLPLGPGRHAFEVRGLKP